MNAPASRGRLILAAGALLSVPLLFSPLANPDVPWHLSAGRWIFANGSVPRQDFLSWSKAGQAWTDFEWGVQALYFGLHSLGGWTALWLFKAATFAALLAAFAGLAALWGLPASWTGLALLPLVLSLVPALDLRPENLTLLFLTGELLLLESRRLGRWRPGDAAFAGAHAALYAVWANLHGGFVFGLALIGFWGVGEGAQRRSWRPWAAALAAAAAGTCLNPFGPRLYGVFLSHARESAAFMADLVEWLPPTFRNAYQRPFWVLLFFSFGVFAWGAAKRKAAPYAHILTLLVFGLAASTSSRNTSIFCVTAFPLALAALHALVPKPPPVRLAFILLAAPAAFAYLSVAPGWLGRVEDPTWRPRGLAEFLRKEAGTLQGLRMYNPWAWGGFLGWELGPDYKVYQDGRYLFHEYLPVVREARQTPEAWRDFLDARGIQLLLVEDKPQWAAVEREGERILRKLDVFFVPRETWALVYWDRQALAFVRRGAVPKDWLKARTYRWLDPSDLERVAQDYRKKRFAAQVLEAEIDRYAAAGGDPGAAARLRAWWAETKARTSSKSSP